MSLPNFPYIEAKRWLIESLRRRLPKDIQGFAETLIDLHLDPRNFPMGISVDYDAIKSALKANASSEDLRKHITFEDTESIAGICRVMIRTHLNRTGIGYVYRALPGRAKDMSSPSSGEKTLNPRVLRMFPQTIKTETLEEYCDYERFVDAWLTIAKKCESAKHMDDPYAFEIRDICSIEGLKKHPYSRSSRKLPPSIQSNWASIVWGAYSGLTHLKKFYDFDPCKFYNEVRAACGSLELIDKMIQKTGKNSSTKIYQYGETLAGSFFADLGYADFVKTDVHVIDSVSAFRNQARVAKEEAWTVVKESAEASHVSPRAVDKVMYIACSSNFYFYSPKKLPGSEREKANFLEFLKSF